jgi:hypothetical protein
LCSAYERRLRRKKAEVNTALTAIEASVRKAKTDGRAHCVVKPNCTAPKQIQVDCSGYNLMSEWISKFRSCNEFELTSFAYSKTEGTTLRDFWKRCRIRHGRITAMIARGKTPRITSSKRREKSNPPRHDERTGRSELSACWHKGGNWSAITAFYSSLP